MGGHKKGITRAGGQRQSSGVQTFKPAEGDLDKLRDAARLLKESNAALAAAKTAVEAAKAALGKWLIEERKCDLGTLAVGEMVLIEGVVLIEIGQMQKFDEKALLLEKPEIHAAYKRPTPVRKFKPVV